MIHELLFYCLVTSLVSIGFFIATEKNNLLYFLKKPVIDWLADIEKERSQELSEVNKYESEECREHGCEFIQAIQDSCNKKRKEINDVYDKQKNLIYAVYKPVFLCPRCMASVWSILVWYPIVFLQYDMNTALAGLIPAMLATATINSVLFNNTDL